MRRADVEHAASAAEAAGAALRSPSRTSWSRDIGMPEVGRLRPHPPGARPRRAAAAIPAIALTAYARVKTAAALKAGFSMHVPKPVEPAELAVVIASLTRGKSD